MGRSNREQMPTAVVNSTARAASAWHTLAGSTSGSFSMSPWVKFTVSCPRCPAIPLGCLDLLVFARHCLSCS